MLEASGKQIEPEVIENQIIDTINLLNEDPNLNTLDILWYLVNTNMLIAPSNLSETEINKIIVNAVRKYSENNYIYDSVADLYRISSMNETFGVSTLDKQKVTAFVNKNTADINKTTILSMNCVLYIAKINEIDLDSNLLRNIFDFADKEIKEMYIGEEISFPDLHELFELLCLIDPDYKFNTDEMLKLLAKFQLPTGLYCIADGQTENLLPTYWGLQIHSKLGLEIDKKDEILLRIRQSQTLDGLYNFVSDNYIEHGESYAANAIYKLLGGKDVEIHNAFGNINEVSPRGRYCYSYFLNDTSSPEQIEAFTLQIQAALKESVQDIRFSKLYMSYFQIVLLKDLNQHIEKEVTEELIINLNTIDTGAFGRTEKLLFCLLENLIRKELDVSYSVSKEAEAVISDFMYDESYKEKEFENDTLMSLYMCIKLIEDDVSLMEKYHEKGMYILEQLLTNDGLFCFGTANKQATYDTTFMGLEILDVLSNKSL